VKQTKRKEKKDINKAIRKRDKGKKGNRGKK
jgi:hypothetical protein